MKNKLLILIFLIGLLARVLFLDKYPVSLTIDEVAIGYNSYSILKTANDEFGNFLPLAFQSIGDYKPPLLIYASIPAIALFGLNEFSVRITTALIGALTVLAVFALSKQLTKNLYVSLVCAFLVAVSPWHIKFSRSTFEAVTALFLSLWGIYFFVKSAKNKYRNLWISSIFFSLSLYAYHAQRVFTPLLVLGLFFIFRKDFAKQKRALFKSLLLGALVILPLLVVFLNPKTTVRAQSTFITRDFEINRLLHKAGENLNLSAKILDNNIILVSNFWTKRYLDYFDPNFLFIKGMDYTKANAPDIGLLYLTELPFFLFGLYLVTFRNYTKDIKTKSIIILLLLLGPLAASLANNAQHPLRSLTSIPVLQLLSSIGIIEAAKQVKNLKTRTTILGVLALSLMVNFVYFLDLYFLHYPLRSSEYAMDGWKKATLFAFENQHKYNEVIIDPKFGTEGPYTTGVPYLYFLFYGKVDPQAYQQDPRRKKEDYNFGKFTFRDINWVFEENSDRWAKDKLFIGSKWVLPAEGGEIVKVFNLFNGNEILRAAVPKSELKTQEK